jgi:hypothetical protein
MKRVLFYVLFFPFLVSFGCSEEVSDSGDSVESGALERSRKIRDLENEVEALRWESTRLALKIETINGGSLVMDKRSGLWHDDVAREPYTGMVIEKYPDRSPRAEAGFLNGKKDGMERFWYPRGILKSEGQWFNGLENGIFREWDEQGEILRAARYKNGQLIENLLN